MRLYALILSCAAALFVSPVASADDRFASGVVSSSNLPTTIYGHAGSVLGKPTMWVVEIGNSGAPPGDYAVSLVYPAWSPDSNGIPVVATLGYYVSGTKQYGQIIVEFDEPIIDDPANWHGMDFIVFGNSIFTRTGTDYLTSTTDMETCYIDEVFSEPVGVSVSPDLEQWYSYFSPTADGYWPTNAFAWDRAAHAWGDELDWTKPVDPSLTSLDFAGKSVADAIDLYAGSAGGTAFDLAESGFASIKYIKVTGQGSALGEVDGFARVGKPLSIPDAKRAPDDIPVSLGPQVVVAGTSELGDCFYIESADRSSGIKVTGRNATVGSLVTVSGVAATVNGEREIRATWLASGETGSVKPLGMQVKSVGGGDWLYQSGPPSAGQQGTYGSNGLNNIGLLVRTWGKVKSVDSTLRTFSIEDGSSVALKCKAPVGVTLPAVDDYVKVTGISSCEMVEGQLLPLLRMRTGDDLQPVPG